MNLEQDKPINIGLSKNIIRVLDMIPEKYATVYDILDIIKVLYPDITKEQVKSALKGLIKKVVITRLSKGVYCSLKCPLLLEVKKD